MPLLPAGSDAWVTSRNECSACHVVRRQKRRDGSGVCLSGNCSTRQLHVAAFESRMAAFFSSIEQPM